MNGDLSLSRALGGLRIANLSDDSDQESSNPYNKTPDTDDDPPNDHASSQPLDSAASAPSQLLRGPSVHTIYSDPNDIAPQRNYNGQPDPFRDPNLYRQPSTRQSPTAHDTHRTAHAPVRPTSGAYPTPTSAPYEREVGPSTYDPSLRSKSSRTSLYDAGMLPSRSNSRSVRAPYNGGLPQRTQSYRKPDRRHELPPGPPGPPPRKSSKGQGGYYANIAGVPMVPEPTNNSFGSHMPPPGSRGEDWQDRGAAHGTRAEVDAEGNVIMRPIKKGVKDFIFGTVLGEGSYSTVFAATDRQNLKEYAIKVLEKKHIIKEKKIKYVNIEKNTLNRLTEHPGIVRLYYTFQDETSLYYVLDICKSGELLGVLKRTGTFDVECTRFYGAEILDSIEYMHSRGVIHRDLKPENVLLDSRMHVKITDFGTAKLLPDPREAPPPDDESSRPEPERAASFVGTAEYVSPELLTDKSAGKASDIWAFGCIIYQLLVGRPPFKAGSEYLTFQKIVGLEYEFPAGFPPAARDLVERCLVLDPTRRLTVEHIKNHEFFDGLNFGKGLWAMQAPRLSPYVPPAKEPQIIQLNGNSGNSTSRALQSSSGSTARPPRIITELPPPTQLDIEWSPVLTRDNERILKLGDLLVTTSPLPHNGHGKQDHETSRKISRFFGGSTLKKKQRLVMVTSSGRVVLAPAGGDEKKAKQEISLLSPDCAWRTQVDVKGQVVWCVDAGGTKYQFEPPKSSSSSGIDAGTADEWIEALEKAKDLAISQDLVGSFGNDNGFGDMASSMSPSPASTLSRMAQFPEGGFSVNDRAGRNQLSRSQASLEHQEARKSHRFSKRQSKNGLGTAAF